MFGLVEPFVRSGGTVRSVWRNRSRALGEYSIETTYLLNDIRLPTHEYHKRLPQSMEDAVKRIKEKRRRFQQKEVLRKKKQEEAEKQKAELKKKKQEGAWSW